jgi:hypothetical protein
MFQAVRNTFIAATAALALGFFGGMAQAATVTLADGDVISPINTNDTYIFEQTLSGVGGPGSVSFDFAALPSQLPLSLAAITINLASFQANISGFYMSLFDGVNTTYATINVTSFGAAGFSFNGALENAFNNSLTQTLTLGWDSYDTGRIGSIQISASVAAVPLPAGGLLLIGAIGGLAALRRRKALAA